MSLASTKPLRISPNGQRNAATRLRIAAQLALPPNHGKGNLVVAVMVFVQVEKCVVHDENMTKEKGICTD